MSERVLLDTGPLVAYLNRREQHHAWALRQWQILASPLLTCEAVLAEACFLVARTGGDPATVLGLVTQGGVAIPLRLDGRADAVAQLMRKYANVPMSLADACLVRMTALYGGSRVFTFDSDFAIYRKHGRQVIQTLMPPSS